MIERRAINLDQKVGVTPPPLFSLVFSRSGGLVFKNL